MTRDKILKAALAYKRRHGKAPSRLSGDASAYFGDPETWLNIDNALRFGLRGVEGPKTSLFKFFVEAGLRTPPPDTTSVSLEQVKQALKAFARDHKGRIPTQINPTDSVEPYLNLKRVSWANLDERLRLGRYGFTGGSSLSQLAVESSLKAERGACPPIEEIQAAAQKFLDETGKLPSLRAGPASHYFGRQETWLRVHSLLKKEHNLSLRDCIHDLKYAGPYQKPQKRSKINLTKDTLLNAVQRFKENEGRLPAYYSGDATPYFEGKGHISWRTVNRALTHGLRGMPKGSSLAKFLVEHGFRQRKSGGKTGI